MKTHPEIEITDAEIKAMKAAEKAEKKAAPRTDPQVVKAYNEYVRDWSQRMSTHLRLQREYMGRY